MLSLALLNALAVTERPSDTCIRLSDIFTGLTATGLASVCAFGGWGAKAVATVAGVQVGCTVFVEVEGGGGDGDGCRVGRQTCEGDAVSDRGLLLAGYVHYIEGEELAGDVRKSDVDVDGELLERNMSMIAIEGRSKTASSVLRNIYIYITANSGDRVCFYWPQLGVLGWGKRIKGGVRQTSPLVLSTTNSGLIMIRR